MNATDLAAVEQAVTALLERSSGGPVDAPNGDLTKLWRAAAEQGWCELAVEEAVDALIRAVRATGRFACPLPLADAYVAASLLSSRPELVGAIGHGEIRPLVLTSPASIDTVEAAGAATHLLILTAGRGRLVRIGSVEPRPGVAVPPWSAVTPGKLTAEVELPPGAWQWAGTLMRLALCARALAAAERTHELALEHAKVREQFGRVIGSFGAVQQRAASGQIDVQGGNRLIDEAVRLLHEGHDDGELAAELAVRHVHDVLPRVQFGAHHTLGAVGFFEEHPAPWLFRRAHADLTRLACYPYREVSELLVEGGRTLPSLDRAPGTAVFRQELRTLFAEICDPDTAVQAFVDDRSVVAAMAERGYYGLTWPKEVGGGGATAAEQSVLMEEIGYGRVPSYVAFNAVMFLGNAILRYGSPEQRDRLLPMIRSGRLRFCLGYSEPETGSDLAALRTRAVRDGDDWVVNGQKTWTTRAHESDWIWLAARTHPDASLRHRGISVFLFPLDTPGITIQQHRSLAGEVSCSLFFDDVRVPDSARVGEVNEGWQIINAALAGERVAMGGVTGSLHRQLDDLLAIVRADHSTLGAEGSAKRALLSSLAARVQAARVLVKAAVDATTEGRGSRLEAPMASVAAGELAEAFGEAALEILGPTAALSHTTGALAGGAFSHNLLLSIKYVVGGGTNDVLRGLIARALGLPR